MTRSLVPSSGCTNAANIRDAHQLVTDVEALGGKAPARLRNLLTSYDLLTTPAPAPNALDAIVDAATDGTLTAKKLGGMVADAAQAHAAEQFRSGLARNAARSLLHRFGQELLAGAADELLDSLRPIFDANAAAIADAVSILNLDQSYQSFIETADPDQLGAYQGLKASTAKISEIIALATQFGPRSVTFPLIERPVEGIGHEEFWLADGAIFTASAEGLRSASIYMHEWDRAQASLYTIKPQDLGMRTSPWARAGLQLNTVAQAREGVRLWAEQTVENSITPGLVDSGYRNPYRTRAEAPGDVEVFGPDGSIARVV